MPPHLGLHPIDDLALHFPRLRALRLRFGYVSLSPFGGLVYCISHLDAPALKDMSITGELSGLSDVEVCSMPWDDLDVVLCAWLTGHIPISITIQSVYLPEPLWTQEPPYDDFIALNVNRVEMNGSAIERATSLIHDVTVNLWTQLRPSRHNTVAEPLSLYAQLVAIGQAFDYSLLRTLRLDQKGIGPGLSPPGVSNPKSTRQELRPPRQDRYTQPDKAACTSISGPDMRKSIGFEGFRRLGVCSTGRTWLKLPSYYSTMPPIRAQVLKPRVKDCPQDRPLDPLWNPWNKKEETLDLQLNCLRQALAPAIEPTTFCETTTEILVNVASLRGKCRTRVTLHIYFARATPHAAQAMFHPEQHPYRSTPGFLCRRRVRGFYLSPLPFQGS
ncbi:hypothetical protein BKA70DRAFT_1241001 [Coprinopsis sp. MPI-PUGE-AT-0042]|nr:hypothetical protein BKA70DRAFT_1241001 [Coprinopsis sp. MPI-PUGE-AT-0042]